MARPSVKTIRGYGSSLSKNSRLSASTEAFLVPGLVAHPLPSSFALAAAYGDLVSGLLALLALVALRGGWGLALPVVWLFNIVGTVDLLNALRQADAVPHLLTTWYIPTFWVPLLLVTHTMIFARLLRRGR